MYEQMIEHMKRCLEGHDLESTKAQPTLFRRRSEHTLRVLAWAELLARDHPDLDLEVLKTAVIFHDIGYATCENKKEHAAESARLCSAYLKGIGFDPERSQRITQMVARHSQKALLHEADTPVEMVVLLEADLLDETGALGIVWDCLTQGNREEQSYAQAYEHILNFTVKGMEANPLVSAAGRRLWDDKRRLVEAFAAHLRTDLGLSPAATPVLGS